MRAPVHGDNWTARTALSRRLYLTLIVHDLLNQPTSRCLCHCSNIRKGLFDNVMITHGQKCTNHSRLLGLPSSGEQSDVVSIFPEKSTWTMLSQAVGSPVAWSRGSYTLAHVHAISFLVVWAKNVPKILKPFFECWPKLLFWSKWANKRRQAFVIIF